MSSTHLASWYTTRVVGVVRVRNVTILIDLSIQVVDKVELAQNRKCVLHMAIHLMPIWHVVHYQRFDLQLSSRIGLDWIGLDWIGLDWIGLDWIGLDWIVQCQNSSSHYQCHCHWYHPM
jgi:hypothetical protein